MRRLALALLAVPLVASACGGATSSLELTPLAAVKGAATKTAAATSEHITMQANVTVQGTKVEVSGDGDAQGTLVQMHADIAAPGLDAGIDEIMSGTTLYMKSPLFEAALPKGKTWLMLDLQKLGRAKGIDFSALMSQSPTDVISQLKQLGDVTEVGSETIDGADTAHYRGRIDLTKVPQGAKIQALTNARYGPYDVWIGKDDGYVRRIHMSYSFAVQGAGRSQAEMTMGFSDFGKDVSITAPPAADTVDVTDKSIPGLGG
jgi:hypothetical protein